MIPATGFYCVLGALAGGLLLAICATRWRGETEAWGRWPAASGCTPPVSAP